MVHLGAGQHSETLWPDYKKLCHRACKKVSKTMQTASIGIYSLKRELNSEYSIPDSSI